MTGTIFFGTIPTVNEALIQAPPSNGTVMVPIVRTGDLTGTATIEYGITPDTATAGVDYVGANGTITMGVGQDRVFVPVQILNDNLSEPTETFVVSIINVDSGSTLLFPRTARVDIRDDENPVVDPPSPPLTSNYSVTQQVVASGSLNQPLSFKFSPQDPSLIYVAEKGGVIKVFDVDTGAQQSTFIDISSKVNSIQDRGLLDIALDPNFGPQHPYVYAFYVVDPPDTAGKTGNAGPDGGGNRFAYVVRFTADAATNYTTAVPGSEVILLGGGTTANPIDSLQDISGAGAVDSTSNFSQPESGFNAQTGQYVENYIKVDSRSHAGGSLAFGPDGALYVSIGDGTSFNATDPRSASVQNIDSLSGKILRIDPLTGLGLPDNPFVQPGEVPPFSANHDKVYQLGLRNPFSMGFTQDGHLFISNTGWNSWEEIESGNAGANFGWPYFEGGDNGVLLGAPGYQNDPSVAAAFTARNLLTPTAFYTAVANGSETVTSAYRAFAHDASAPGFQLVCIVGGEVAYSGSRYPAEFQNDYFFTDTSTGNVFVVDLNNRSDVKYLYNTGGVPVSFSQGPDGYVYVANLIGGTITRLLIDPLAPPGSPGTLTPHGSASVNAGVFTLTTATNQVGTAMSTGRIDVSQNFTIAFDVNLGSNDGGADGAAFVLHNDPRGVNAIGVAGSGLAVGGIQNGLAIEFDTYKSTAANLVSGRMPGSDIAADHTNFLDTDGSFATAAVALPNIENGALHHVVVTWNAQAQTLSYTFDNGPQQVLDIRTIFGPSSNIATQFLGGSNLAYFGFGAGTGGLSNTQSVSNISVNATFEGQTPGNSPPIANPDTATTAAGQSVPIAVLANDSDPNGDPLAIATVSTPVHGTATPNQNNTVTYTPLAGYSGPDSFTYTITDGTTTSAPATVNVTVTNSTPIAVNDAATTPAGQSVQINVLANDSDPNGDLLTIATVSTPARGTTAANQTNTAVTYTPLPGYSGPDSFTYTITDGTTTSSPATVNVTVTPPPSAVTLTPHGSASVNAGVFTLTTATNQVGTAMSTGRIDVSQNFTIAFDVNLGSNDGGADGAAFVLHNDPRGVNAIGVAGSGLAVGGIQNGLAIEFDTYKSTAANLVSGRMPGSDIAADHTNFLDTDGSFATAAVALPNIENGALHHVVVTWNAQAQTLSYTFDNGPQQVLDIRTIFGPSSNIATQFLGGSNLAYFGFGAGTGGLSNTQSVSNINVSATFEGQTPAALALTAVSTLDTNTAGTPVSGDVTLRGFNAATASIERWQGNGKGMIGTGAANTFDLSALAAIAGLAFVDGGGGADLITGSSFADDLRGGAGNDTLNGGDGNDTLNGGPGIDTLSAGNGDDSFVLTGTEAQKDTMDGGAGTDSIQVTGTSDVTLAGFNATASSIESWQGNGHGVVGTAAANTFDLSGLTTVSGLAFVDGGGGADTITGSSFADDLRGSAGNDTLNGGDGNDTLNGGAGTDLLNGGNGADTFVITGNEAQNDTMNGGAGTDSILVIGPSDVTLAGFNATASSIETWQGNGQGIVGTGAANTFDLSLNSVTGLAFVDGGGGADTITGSSFADDLRGGTGNDAITGAAGADLLTGGAGSDTFLFKSLVDSLPGAGNFDTVIGFTHAADKLDFTAITDLTGNATLVTTPGTVATHGASYYQSGNDTVVIANAGNTADHVDLEIHLTGVTASSLTSSDFLHAI